MISFSICIPNYNYARYIGETIQSVLDQTYPHFEIVVVDNASTDNSVEVVKSFADPRIKLYVNQYNVGFAPNLDRAAQRASNDFIIMLSSDDVMRPTALEEYAKILLKLAEGAHRVLLTSSCEVIDQRGMAGQLRDRKFHFTLQPNNERLPQIVGPKVEVFSGLAVFKEVFPRMSVPGQFCTQMYSRTLYESVGGYSSLNPIGPDAYFAYKILLQDVSVIFIDKPLFGYRVHQSNQLSTNRNRRTINLPVDRYVFSLAFSDEELKRARVERREVIHFLIDDTCLKTGLFELVNGERLQAFRLLMFALSSYPRTAIGNWKFYALSFLLLLGPLSIPVSRGLYRWYLAMNVRSQ